MQSAQHQGLAVLSPANFGMVMATGIVSLAAHFLHWPYLPLGLFYLNNVLYAVLCVLTLARAWRHGQALWQDMTSHLRGPGFFTFVAGTSVLGSQYIVMLGQHAMGVALWVLGVVSWILLTYTVFAAIITKEDKPSLDQGITGAWLLAVVAVQSIAVLSTLVAAHWAQPHRLELNFVALSMWLWGGMLYIWMMSLLFYRYTFFRLAPGDLAPPYWINMGAMAISTLAGSLLIENSADAPYLHSLLPFLKGFTIFYWATATWWIPMLLVLGVWRHVVKRFPLRYDPLYWGAVFPLGMYTACTFKLSAAMGFDFMSGFPALLFPVALAAWIATFVGLLGQVVRWQKSLSRA